MREDGPAPTMRRPLLLVMIAAFAAVVLTAGWLTSSWADSDAASGDGSSGSSGDTSSDPSGPSGTSGSSAAAAASCDEQVRLVTATSFEPVLNDLAAALAGAETCVDLQVTVADGEAAAGAVASTEADVWIPDDAAWANLPGPAAVVKDAGATVATSPLLFEMTQETASTLPAQDSTWAGLAADLATKGSTKLVVRDPLTSGDGLVAGAALSTAVAVDNGPLTAANDVMRARQAGRTVRDGAAVAQAPGEVAVVPEFRLLRADAPTAHAVRAPTDATALMRFTWLPTESGMADRPDSLDAVYGALTGDQGRDVLRSNGFRAGDWPAAAPAVEGRTALPEPAADPMKVTVEHYVWHVLSTWDPAQRKANLLVVTDVSGSMGDPAPGGGAPLIDLVRGGLGEVSALLPDDAQLGLWQFGYQLAPPVDYQALVEPAPLDPAQRERLAAATTALRPLRTGTSLYSTILAAYRYQQDHFDPSVPNQVVVFTDGVEEDSPDTLELAALQTALAEADPAKHVQLAVFAYGDRLPVDALSAAMKPVGGHVDPLTLPSDVTGAFVHAVSGGLTH